MRALITIAVVGLALTMSAQAQFTYVTNNGAITITGYSGPGGAVSIPSTANGWPVTGIGESAFASLFDVTSVTLPDSVTNIEQTAFATCYFLSAITVSINNPVYSSVAGVLFDKSQTTLIQYPSYKSGTSYTIPNSVTSIGNSAFYNCYILTNVTIPNSVTSIGNSGFNSCHYLSSITIPDSVTHLGDHGFMDCKSLTSVTIGNGVPSIEDSSFEDCIGLTNLTIGSSVTNIGDWAFMGCGLTSVTIPDSVTSIGNQAFSWCGLTSVTIGNSVTRIGAEAFGGLHSLTNVTIPASVTGIGDNAFSYCSNLRGVYFLGNAPSGDSTVFWGDNNATVYYLPGTGGWGATFGGLPTALWVLPYPQILANAPSFGVQTNRFGFIISWATNLSVAVEASTTLAHPVWLPLSTNALVNGWSYFSDPEWTNYPARFYRVRSP